MSPSRFALAAAALVFLAATTGTLAKPAPEGAAAPSTEPEPVPYLEQVTDGYIDWGEGIVAAWGKAINSEEAYGPAEGGQVRYAAELNAKARLLAIVQNLRANAEFRIGDRPDVVERVSGIVRGARVIKDRPGKGRFYEILMTAPLHGVEGLSYTVYEMTIPATGRPAGPTGGEASEAGAGTAPSAGSASPAAADADALTGIVIDARGTGLQPALLPRILDPAGNEVAAPSTVNQDDLKERGMAAYATQPGSVSEWRDRVGDAPMFLHAVRVNPGTEMGPAAEIGFQWMALTPETPPARRVRRPVPAEPERVTLAPGQPRPQTLPEDKFPDRKGPRPYRLKAAEAAGTLKADLVLSKADADRLEANPEAIKRLKECRVLVIVESPVGGVEGVRLRPPAPRPWPPGG